MNDLTEQAKIERVPIERNDRGIMVSQSISNPFQNYEDWATSDEFF